MSSRLIQIAGSVHLYTQYILLSGNILRTEFLWFLIYYTNICNFLYNMNITSFNYSINTKQRHSTKKNEMNA